MDIIISNSSDNPIYEQICTQIKAQIINGTLNEGDILPSIRHLAKDLRISVITTKRAYEELEKDGFIETVKGKGSYVAQKNLEIIKENELKDIEALIIKAKEKSKRINLSEEEFHEIVSVIFEEE